MKRPPTDLQMVPSEGPQPSQEPPGSPVPQNAFELPGRQLLLLSQQPLQLAALQAGGGAMQACALQVPAPHALQAAPPLPQALAMVPVWQVPLASQQPLVHGFVVEPGPQAGPGGLQAVAPDVAHMKLPPQDWQVSEPDSHASQASPGMEVPQRAFEVPGRQLLLLSQQPAQLSGPQAVAQAWFEQV
jgi:hypothetical protein